MPSVLLQDLPGRRTLQQRCQHPVVEQGMQCKHRLLVVVQSWRRTHPRQGCIAVAVFGMCWPEVETMCFRTLASRQQADRRSPSLGWRFAQTQVGLHRTLDEVGGCSRPPQAEEYSFVRMGRNASVRLVAGYGQLYDMKSHQHYDRIADHRKHHRGQSTLAVQELLASSVKASAAARSNGSLLHIQSGHMMPRRSSMRLADAAEDRHHKQWPPRTLTLEDMHGRFPVAEEEDRYWAWVGWWYQVHCNSRPWLGYQGLLGHSQPLLAACYSHFRGASKVQWTFYPSAIHRQSRHDLHPL